MVGARFARTRHNESASSPLGLDLMDTMGHQRSCWPRVLFASVLLVVVSGGAFVWCEFYRTEDLSLFSPLTASDPYAFDANTPVYLDEDCVGHVVNVASADG